MSALTFGPRPLLAGAAPAIVQASLAEAFSPRLLDGSAIAFVLALLGEGPVLWAQDRLSRREAGQPCLAGTGRRMLLVDAAKPEGVLAAMEDGLSARIAVVGEIYGSPRALDFTASRRLAMRAEAAGVSCWLIRHAASADASAARQRWRVGALPSATHPDDPASPGAPRWRVELFRSRLSPPGEWSVTHDRASDCLDFSPLAGDGAVAARDGAPGRAAGR